MEQEQKDRQGGGLLVVARQTAGFRGPEGLELLEVNLKLAARGAARCGASTTLLADFVNIQKYLGGQYGTKSARALQPR